MATKYKVKAPFMQDLITNFRQLELKLEEERYFPPEEILTPTQVEYRMKKLNFMDRKARFRTILEQMRGEVS